MAIIYTYPQINSSSDLAASDLMIISDMSANGRPTKSLTLKNLADFVTSTGTGTGTTNAIIKWSDGPAGLLGDSIMNEDTDKINLNGILRIAESNNNRLEIKYGTDSDTSHLSSSGGNASQIIGRAGDLIIKNRARTRDIVFQADNGEYNGNVATYFRLDGSMADVGNSDYYTRWSDNSHIVLGNSANANNLDFNMYHDGSDTYLINGSSFLYVESKGGISIENKSGGSGDIDIIQSVTNADVNISAYNGTYFRADTSAGATIFSKPVEVPLVPAANANAASKQYVDQQIASIPAGLVFQGNWNASTNTPTLASGVGTVGNYYVVSVAGNTNLDGITDWEVGDWAVFVEVGGVDKWDKIDQTFVQGAGATGQVSFWNGINSVTGDNDLYWDNVNKRLGIGTATPGNKLELQVTSNGHGILFKSNATQIGSILRTAIGGTVSMTIDGAGTRPININNSSSSNVLIANGGGNVGIGTTSPSQKLDVVGNINLDGTSTRVFFGGNNTFIGENSNSNELILRGGGSGTAQSVYIDNSGNVGIGNSNPSEKLQVEGNIQLGTFNKISGGSSDNLVIAADFNNASGGSSIDFQLDGATSAMFINNSRNIGIGTTSPLSKLHVESGGSDNVARFVSTDLRARIEITDSADASYFGTINGITFLGPDDTSGGNNINILSTGNVGIGTNSPAYKLHVDGSIKVNTGDNIFLGNANDLALEHNGSLSQITNATGHFYIQNTADDKDIIFRSDDGSGGLAEYFRLDGSVGSGSSVFTVFPDNSRATFGNSYDLQIYHDASNSYLKQQGGGHLIIQQETNDADITFKSDDGSGGIATYMTIDGGVEMTTFSKDTRHNDNVRLNMGDQNDLHLRHNGTNGFITNSTGNLYITNESNNEDIIFRCDDGAGGVATYFYLDGSLTTVTPRTVFPDNSVLGFGTGADLQIYHDGTTSNIANYTNNLSIINHFNDGDIKFFSDDGSGGVTEYFRLDGGSSRTIFSKNQWLTDNVKILLGNNDDLEIYHSGSHSIIQDNGTGDLLLRGNNLRLQNSDGLQTFLHGYNNSGVEIYYNAVKKFETTSTGIDVTGRIGLNDGNDNVLVGDFAGDALTTGTSNIAIGTNALSAEDTGARSVAIGEGALQLQNNDQNNYNIAIGHHAGNVITTGIENTLIGALAGDAITTASHNIAIGKEALSSEDTGGRNIAIGHRALRAQNYSSSGYNIAIGYDAGLSITTGVQNTLIGGRAGDAITTGNYNVALGYLALTSEDAHGKNTAIGYGALSTLNAGVNGNNVSVGYNAGSAIDIGFQNTCIGSEAGLNITSGENNTLLGFGATASAADVDNEIVLGNSSVDTLRCATQTISALSDERDKTNIQESKYGLDFIDKLNPVTFDWNTRDGSKKGKKDLGFIAQELDQIDDEYTRLVYKSNPDKLEASYGRLIPILVKAIQELSAEVKMLKNK